MENSLSYSVSETVKFHCRTLHKSITFNVVAKKPFLQNFNLFLRIIENNMNDCRIMQRICLQFYPHFPLNIHNTGSHKRVIFQDLTDSKNNTKTKTIFKTLRSEANGDVMWRQRWFKIGIFQNILDMSFVILPAKYLKIYACSCHRVMSPIINDVYIIFTLW